MMTSDLYVRQPIAYYDYDANDRTISRTYR